MKYVATAVLLLLLAGCRGDPQPKFSPSPTVSSSATAATKGAAETPQDFLRRWYKVSDRMELTGSTKVFDSMHLKSCKGCSVYADSVRAMYLKHQQVVGTRTKVIRAVREAGGAWMVDITERATKILDQRGRRIGGFPGGRSTFKVSLAKVHGEWRVRDAVRVVS